MREYHSACSSFSQQALAREVLAGSLEGGLNACVECCDRWITNGRVALDAPAPVDARALLSKNDLRPFIKHPNFDKDPAERYGSTCAYSGAVIQIDAYAFSAYETRWNRDKAKVDQVAGLGDAALFYRSDQMFVEIAVRKGQRTFAALVDVAQGETMDAAKTRAIGLARAAVAILL